MVDRSRYAKLIQTQYCTRQCTRGLLRTRSNISTLCSLTDLKTFQSTKTSSSTIRKRLNAGFELYTVATS